MTILKDIFAATERSDAQALQQLLKQSESSVLRGLTETTPLHVAAEQGSVECLRLLLLRCNLNAQADASSPYAKKTALMLAMLQGHVECVQLLAADSDHALQDGLGETAWNLAFVGTQTKECLQALLACAPFYIHPEAKKKRVASDLHSSVDERSKIQTAPNETNTHESGTIEAPVESAAREPAIQTSTGTSPPLTLPSALSAQAAAARRRLAQEALNTAASENMIEVVRILVDAIGARGCDNEEGETALMSAVWWGHLECAQFLLPHSNARAVNHRGVNALMMAARHGNAECTTLLLPHSDLNAQSNDEETALMMAAKDDDMAAFLLLAPYSDLHHRNNDGNTCLSIAAMRGNLKTLQWIAPQVDINQVNNAGLTPLMMAVEGGRRACAWALLDGSDVNQMAANGETALIKATIRHDDKFVAALLEHQADPQAVDECGRNALLHAITPVAGDFESNKILQLLWPVSTLTHVDQFNECALLRAAQCGYVQTLRKLLPFFEAVGEEFVAKRARKAVIQAQHRGYWASVDALAPWMQSIDMQEAIQKAPNGALPHCVARLEQESLEQTLRGPSHGNEKPLEDALAGAGGRLQSRSPSPVASAPSLSLSQPSLSEERPRPMNRKSRRV